MADFSSLKMELDSWTLASDERFLNQMKIYFGEVMNRIGQVDRLAETIDYNSTLVHSVINSSFNTLSNLSNSCFLENAMEEATADMGMRKSVVQSTPKETGNFEANLIGNFAKAVKLGMDGLEILKSMEDEDNDKGSMVSTMGPKFDRLPAIVGSKIFKDEDFLGIIEKMEEPQFDFPNAQNGAVGMNQSTSLSQSQQVNSSGPNLAAPNLNLNQPQNNTSSLQPPQLQTLQQPQQQSNNTLPPPNLNPSGPGGSSGGGLGPPPSLGLLLANKEVNDKKEKEERVNQQVQGHPVQREEPRSQQPEYKPTTQQLSIADALKLKFAGNQVQQHVQQNQNSGNQYDPDDRPMTFNPEDLQRKQNEPGQPRRITDIANNPMYKLNQKANLNSMFDDDDQDDDFGGDLFKGNKKKNKFQDLLSGNPMPTKPVEDTTFTKKETPLANPIQQQPQPVTKKTDPPKKTNLFTDTETDGDIANVKTDNKKLKKMFDDSEDEADVLQRGKQLSSLYKKEIQPEPEKPQPKRISKLFMDEDGGDDPLTSKNTNFNPTPEKKADDTNEKKMLDMSVEESKVMDMSQKSSRPSVTKVSGRISELQNKLNIDMDALKIQNPAAKPYLRPSLKGDGSTTPTRIDNPLADQVIPNSDANNMGVSRQSTDNYTEMLMNKAPIAVRKTQKLDFSDSDSDSKKWSDDDKNKKPVPVQQPIKVEEKPVVQQQPPVQQQPVTKVETKGDVSPRNFKYEDSQKDYFGKNDLLGGEMTTSVTSTRGGATNQPQALPKDNPLDLLKNLNNPIPETTKTKSKKEEPKIDTVAASKDPNNPLALLGGLKAMDKQHKKAKNTALFDDDDDDLFSKPAKQNKNLWGDEPTETKKAAPAKKTKLFDDSDDDRAPGSFFKKATPDVQKPTLAEPKKETTAKAKKPLWDDSD